MIANALACVECGAGLPPPDPSGSSSCVYCGAEHRSDRSSTVLAAASTVIDHGHSDEDAARIPLTDDAVLELLRRQFADTDSVFVCPHVPPSREEAARRAHATDLPRDERILALHDGAGIDAGYEGFVITTRRICWKNAGEGVRSVSWQALDPDQVYLDGRHLFLGEDALELSDSVLQDACANVFLVLALSGMPPRPIASGSFDAQAPFRHGSGSTHRRSATPPPPYTTSYFAYASHAQSQAPDCACWHCQTPLYETAPQCAFCGAEPSPAGWSRTG